jgi:hypothetical protein
MNDVSVPLSIDIFESLTIEFGTEEIFASREIDMLALFSIASGPNCHRLPFPTDEYRDFFLIDPSRLESRSG